MMFSFVHSATAKLFGRQHCNDELESAECRVQYHLQHPCSYTVPKGHERAYVAHSYESIKSTAQPVRSCSAPYAGPSGGSEPSPQQSSQEKAFKMHVSTVIPLLYRSPCFVLMKNACHSNLTALVKPKTASVSILILTRPCLKFLIEFGSVLIFTGFALPHVCMCKVSVPVKPLRRSQ